MEDRLHREEFQSAIGNVLAELDNTRDLFRRGQIDRETYNNQVISLRKTGRRFHREFYHAWNVMAAPTR